MSRYSFFALCSLLLVSILHLLNRSASDENIAPNPPGRFGEMAKKANSSLTIRPANESDIDRITEIAIAGFPYDPQWDYRYPYRKEYPKEHYHYVRLAYKEYWNRTVAGANQMILTESPRDDDHNTSEVVAFSIWDNPGSKTAVPPVTNYFDRPDGDAARMHAYLNATMKARQEVFVARYGPDQMSLRMMVTHPDYWRRGAAHLLVDWGVKLATEKKVAIVMFSSPMGKALYETFGFRELAKVHVYVDGEKERLDDISCMAWEHGWANSSAVDGMSEKFEVTESLETQS